jgi:hypothetical protein
MVFSVISKRLAKSLRLTNKRSHNEIDKPATPIGFCPPTYYPNDPNALAKAIPACRRYLDFHWLAGQCVLFSVLRIAFAATK